MQFTSIILALCLSFFVLAKNNEKNAAVAGVGTGVIGNGKKNSTRGNPEKKQCSEISRLIKLTNLANNATKLTELETKHKMSTAKINELKASAVNATTRLTELQSNTTLTTQCAIIDAGKKLKKQCKEMTMLTRMMDVANNATALSEMAKKKKWDEEERAKFKAHAANATAKLTKLKSNTTLVDACATIQKTSNISGSAKASQSDAARLMGNAVFALLLGGAVAFSMA